MQTTLRCSYCKYPGHNIRNCNHPTIDYNLSLIREKHATYYYNRGGSPIARALMVNYLYYSFNLDQIRSIVVRLRIGNASVSKTNGIDLICNHLNFQNRIIDLQDDTLTWSVDRNPDPIINNTNRVETRTSAHLSPLAYELVEDPWTSPNANIASLQGIATIAQQLIQGNWIPAYTHTNYLYQSPPQFHVDPIKMKLVNSKNEKINSSFDCPICLDCFDQENTVKLNCDHVFCGGCIGELIKANIDNITCALCRVKVTTFEVSSNDVCEKLKIHRDRIELF